ncbi:hypothetical protein VNO77_29744 [Canavalia gladiata]|uniref:Uncharacterized protein n=1 Tax=Canavalia gladiata TaxID=3824 RepID=A0AAN9Q3Z5_CANGL
MKKGTNTAQMTANFLAIRFTLKCTMPCDFGRHKTVQAFIIKFYGPKVIIKTSEFLPQIIYGDLSLNIPSSNSILPNQVFIYANVIFPLNPLSITAFE